MNIGFLLASVLTALVWAIHTFLGGPTVARPLLAANMDEVAKLTNYYCWHLVTLTLGACAAGFLYAALSPGGYDVAVLVTALILGFAGWGLLLIVWKRQPTSAMPQWLLFVIVAIPAIYGLWDAA